MNGTRLAIPDVILVEHQVFRDERGFFFENFNQTRFDEIIGTHICFVQDNYTGSNHHVLRGLHYQIRRPQGKLIHVTQGKVFDVAVDLRRASPTFGQWLGQTLSAENKTMLWIPPGFAHGFLVLSDYAECLYKTTEYWDPQYERCLAWNDPDLGIEWPIDATPVLSAKDQAGKLLRDAEVFE